MSVLLPNKTLRLSNSVIGIGAVIIQHMESQETVSSLWEKVKHEEAINTFEKFVTGLVFLFSLQAVQFQDGILRKSS